MRWDVERPGLLERSYVRRLTDEDRARSLDEPGSHNGMFRVVYRFENEMVGEVINATVHAFLAFALEPTSDGYTVYLAIYVQNISRLTPLYMVLIDPFRRALVYPALLTRLQHAWSAKYPQ